MWSERTKRFWRNGLAADSRATKMKVCIVLLWMLLCISGCGNSGEITAATVENESVQTLQQGDDKKSEGLAEIYCNIYETAMQNGTTGDLETVRNMVKQLGEKGYVAVDSENQINMTENKKAEQFCKKADGGKKAEITIVVVSYDGGFTQYDLTVNKGEVNVTRGYYQYQNGKFEQISLKNYPAYEWQYTKEGYLFFEEYHMSGYDGMNDFTALRIKPLDETCREWNRKYILPIGYKRNNMFLSDWNEDDFGNLNFYDLFDIFYPIVTEKSMPYTGDENSNAGMVYHIAKTEFESIIMSFFPVNSEILQSKTTYLSKEESYEYRPRGLEDCEPPEVPYPEVVNYKENKDGTITLTVHAVYPKEHLAKAYAHEVVVRPFHDGNWQYVSNHIIPSEDNREATWHVERLTKEEWEAIYEKGYNLPVDIGERDEAEADCKKIMELVSDIYVKADKGEATNVVLSEETVNEMLTQIKEEGYPVIAATPYSHIEADSNIQRNNDIENNNDIRNQNDIENDSDVDIFLEKCKLGKSGFIITYEVHSDGGIGRRKYIFDGTEMYVFSTNATWTKENKPVIANISYTRIKEWNYTDQGWFCYELCVPEPPEVTETVLGDVLIKVKSLNKEYKEITEKYLLPLGYKGNNLLCSNWDAEHMEKLDYNALFQYLYSIEYEEELTTAQYPEGIPKTTFENLLTKYLPITSKQLEQYALYNSQSQTYPWTSLNSGNYIPNFFGTSIPELVDTRENEDGTMTLTVNAVCEQLGDESIITHYLTILIQDDGSIMYLQNQISQDDLQKIPNYQYRF